MIVRDNITNHKDRPSADGFQELLANHLMLQKAETPFVVNDKEKGNHELFRWG